MSFLKSALELADKGFHVFPVIANSKKPLIKDFPNLATKDHNQIKKWWLDPVLGLEKPYNVGISTSHFNCTQSLIVVDVDDKGDKRGSDEIVRLEMLGNEFPKTFTQRTPSGGEHLIYKHSEAVKQGTNVLAKGLDIRSKGGYIVATGSQIDEGFYKTLLDVEVNDCPEWIIAACGKPAVKSELIIDIENINQKAAKNRAIYYLENEAPFSLEGDGGTSTAYKVAARIKDMGLSKESCVEVLLEKWNDNCEPPWSYEEIENHVECAFRYGTRVPGEDAPESEFEPVPNVDQIEGNYLEEMNKEFALLFESGAHTIIRETTNHKGENEFRTMTETSFKRLMSPYTIELDGGKRLPQSQAWLNWDGRREYKGLCFLPQLETPEGYYNMWTGFKYAQVAYSDATPEAREAVDMFKDHVLENLAEGDQFISDWITCYLAQMIQQPYKRPMTTVVLKGRKGVGKNVPLDMVGRLLGGRHSIVAHDSRYLTSNFNGHMDACLMLVLDEAFWSGDKSAEGKLKGLTTAEEILIERKGKETYKVDNFMRLFIIGNEEWLVPASMDERRYAVFNVGESRMQDNKYFTRMTNLMKAGGYSVLLDYLMTFDLKKANINIIPKTQALSDQKISSLGVFERFWMDCLKDGSVLNFSEKWETTVSKKDFRDAFYNYHNKIGVRGWKPTAAQIGRLINEVCPPTISSRLPGNIDSNRPNCYLLPELEECRQIFENIVGGEIDWSN